MKSFNLFNLIFLPYAIFAYSIQNLKNTINLEKRDSKEDCKIINKYFGKDESFDCCNSNSISCKGANGRIDYISIEGDNTSRRIF
ncbi:hypothetical protein PIROE2DRAFT_13896 [Piromyces sp. E2]|nr:hypothetical protein PIROE2DRAFT_13896 [Piromyces sp. E2]|eukprot:OUM60351.1 hypothetical protein PIROE2DRAFT_13896 [Piromyces sp. E2]